MYYGETKYQTVHTVFLKKLSPYIVKYFLYKTISS